MNLNISFEIFTRVSKNEYITKFMRFYMAYLLITGLLQLLIFAISNDNYYYLKIFYWQIMNECCLGLLALIIFFKETKLNHSEVFLTVLQIYFYICLSIFRGDYNIDLDIKDSFPLDHIFFLPLLANINWKYNVASAFIINTFNIAMISQRKGFSLITSIKIIEFLASILFVSMGSYLKQMLFRHLHSQIKKDSTSLSCYQNLIKKVIPSSIFIIRNDTIVFQNLHTQRLLRCPKFMKIEEILNKIIINDIILDSDELLPEEIDLKNEEIRLFDYLQKYAKNVAPNCGFHEIFGKIEEFNNFNMYRNISKSSRYLKIKISNILWEGEESLIVIMSEDYHGEKINILSNQAKYKDQLLATVSHDLRTPLNGVIGMLEMALDLISDKLIKKSLNIALRSSQLLLFMINDILDFSLISSGKLRLVNAVFDVVQCLKDVSKLIKFQAKKKGLKFEFENRCLGSEQYLIRSDPNRLKQVILNLLGNALKFTQKGYIKLCLEPLDTPFSVKIFVEDSGTGIKEEDIPKLFKLFGKLEGEDNEKLNVNGIGLGLAISQSLIRKLNSDNGEEIKVQSVYGKGSVFFFNLRDIKLRKISRLPTFNSIILKNKSISLDPEDFDEKRGMISVNEMQFQLFQDLDSKFNEQSPLNIDLNYKAAPIEMSKLRTKNILVVDDDQINIMVYSSFLNTFPDCRYDLAFNGQHALDLLLDKATNNTFYDIIFMDCNMPFMDGFAATEKIIQLTKENIIPKVPIIASTANSLETEKEKCFRCGMIDFVSKPFGRMQIRSKINKYCL